MNSDGLRGLQTEPGSNRIAADECVRLFSSQIWICSSFMDVVL